MLTRRSLLAAPLLALPTLEVARAAETDLARALADLERRHGGRLGVAILSSGSIAGYRTGERFPICSTYKFLAAACVLARVDRGAERLDRRMVYTKDAVVTYSPVTAGHVGEPGLDLAALCDAAITLSDNTAGNLLFDSFGGPEALNTYLRGLGDTVTHLDRRETALNEALPGDPRDTTSPEAMARNLEALLLGPALSTASRAQAIAWLVACKTGGKRLRAGVPKDWKAGDKTGTGERGTTNDIAIFWPPGREPLIVAAYYEGSSAPEAERSAVLADVGRLAATL